MGRRIRGAACFGILRYRATRHGRVRWQDRAPIQAVQAPRRLCRSDRRHPGDLTRESQVRDPGPSVPRHEDQARRCSPHDSIALSRRFAIARCTRLGTPTTPDGANRETNSTPGTCLLPARPQLPRGRRVGSSPLRTHLHALGKSTSSETRADRFLELENDIIKKLLPIPAGGRSRTRALEICPQAREALPPRFRVAGTEVRSAGRDSARGRIASSPARAVEALHKTILDDWWRPAFVRYLQVRFTGLKRQLEQ